MSEKNKEVVLRFIEAFSNGDGAAAAACLSPDAVAYAKGFGKLSGARPYDAIVGNAAAFRELMPSGLRPTITAITAEADRVAVEFEGNAVLANGQDYCNQYCMTFTLDDGRINQLNEYYCTILADAKIGPLLGAVEEQRNAVAV